MTGQRPNLLLVTTDQQRRDTVGPGAPGFLRTPHLDQLAHEGIRFDAAYASTPVCVPSRVTLLTGRSALRHGMTHNGRTCDVLAPDAPTLPARLGALGYATVGIGKMHFTPPRAHHGFDELILPDDYYRAGVPAMRHGLGQNELAPGMATVPEAETLTSWLSERAVEHIRYRRDPTRPLFLWLSYSKPHPPLDPPEPYYSMYRDAPVPEPVVGDWAGGDAPAAFRRQRHRGSFDLLDAATVRAARAAYYGLVTQLDYNLGRVLAALQDAGELTRTTIVFTSDHGEFLGDHRTGNKVFFHEAAAGVPMIVRPAAGTSAVPPGTVVRTPVTLADVLPTFVAAAGGPDPDDVDGVDLVALAAAGDRPRVVVGLAGGDAGPPGIPYYLAMTDGRHKYVWYPEGPAEQLFDLSSDPLELHDLARTGSVADWRDRLVTALVDAGGERHLTADGALPAVEPMEETVAEQRANGWPGYHTEAFYLDVRH
ncbi:sulfatase-like hydrolase/transferase [Jiangella sp. DSM 45060]|uniref:sulfatase-like hydrolase/transferase n=1 Tax=Jiangella sp. DSM 45060 TaxID=1798224 RepID=UPI00087A1505|nr:sulfatase-like hydrolase/transferase [Jiangella sp. DSM 45060]SDT69814.1 Arylsulfatase A [Jiangella sp. DSM 45060]